MMSNRSPNGSVSAPSEPDTEVVARADGTGESRRIILS